MNCWFYAAKTIVFQRTGRLIFEADYATVGSSIGPVGAFSRPTAGRGGPVAAWLRDGLPLTDYDDFAARFDFSELPNRPVTWSALDIESSLRRCGPLHFTGYAATYGHAVVLSGIDANGNVHYGDPANGQMSTAPLATFNAWKQQMMNTPRGQRFSLMNPMYHPETR